MNYRYRALNVPGDLYWKITLYKYLRKISELDQRSMSDVVEEATE